MSLLDILQNGGYKERGVVTLPELNEITSRFTTIRETHETSVPSEDSIIAYALHTYANRERDMGDKWCNDFAVIWEVATMALSIYVLTLSYEKIDLGPFISHLESCEAFGSQIISMQCVNDYCFGSAIYKLRYYAEAIEAVTSNPQLCHTANTHSLAKGIMKQVSDIREYEKSFRLDGYLFNAGVVTLSSGPLLLERKSADKPIAIPCEGGDYTCWFKKNCYTQEIQNITILKSNIAYHDFYPNSPTLDEGWFPVPIRIKRENGNPLLLSHVSTKAPLNTVCITNEVINVCDQYFRGIQAMQVKTLDEVCVGLQLTTMMA